MNKPKVLYLLYVLLDVNSERGSLVGVFLSKKNAISCQDVLLARNPDLVTWILAVNPDRVINPFSFYYDVYKSKGNMA